MWPLRAVQTVERDGLRLYEDQPSTLPELIERAARREPARPAVRDAHGPWLDYEGLWLETERVAGTLQRRHGVRPGDQVVFVAANSRDLLVGVLATWRAGGVAVMINAKYTVTEIQQRLAFCSPRVILVEAATQPKVPARTHLLGEAGGEAGGEAFQPPRLGGADPALLMFTSGTTGVSKPVLQSHLNLVSAAETWVRCLGLQPSDSTVVAAPMYHVTGLNGQSLPVLAAGGQVTIMPRFDPASLADQLEAGTATFFHASPTIYTLLTRAAGDRRARGLFTCVSGGASVTRALVAAARTYAPGCDFRISYGMTETSSPAVLTPSGWIDDRPGNAVGVTVPVDDVSVDEGGEILFRGATVITGSEWLRSGDIGTIDDRGFVTVVDRIKDIINRGGEKIASLEVEDVLTSHPGVLDAAVVAKADETFGEVPVAFVVGDASEGSIRAHAAQRLARYKIPVEFVFVEELPRNPAGKVLKAELRERSAPAGLDRELSIAGRPSDPR